MGGKLMHLGNTLNKVVERIDRKLIKLEKEAKASKVPPFGMERLSFKDSLRRLEQLPTNERQRTTLAWRPEERRKAIDLLGGPLKFMEMLDK